MRWDPRAFPKCPPHGESQPLRSALFPWCPLSSRTHQDTSARMTVAFGTELGPEPMTVEPFYDTDGGQSFNIEGHEPVNVYFFANGVFRRSSSDGGLTFDLAFPAVETFPGGPTAAITELAFDLGSARVSPATKRRYFSLRMPRRCGAGLRFQAVTAFAGGEPLRAHYRAPCPYRTRRAQQ
jgi:hypothetical protein